MTSPTTEPSVDPSTRIVVTGGSGFLGTNVMAELAWRGYRHVTNLDIAPPQDRAQRDTWRPIDLRDPAATVAAFVDLRPNRVIHLAARADLGGATIEDYAINTIGVDNVIDAVHAAGTVERAVFVSSQLVCTPGHRPTADDEYSPPNPYGESKVHGERAVRARMGDDTAWALVRPTSIWGPWWTELYSAFFRSVQRGVYLHPRGMDVRKSFGFVGNAAAQYERLLGVDRAALHGRTLYQADPEPTPMREWADEIASAFGRRRTRQVPLPVLRALAAGGDLAKRAGVAHPPISSYRLHNMTTSTPFDTTPLVELCGPPRYDRATGTRITVEWMGTADLRAEQAGR